MYENMGDILKDGKCGDFEISHFEVGNNDLYAILHGIPMGKFVRLTHKGQVVMSDTDMEKRTNAEFIQKAHGNILIGGLGIGMIILPIQGLEDVKKITVIEKYQEVIDLVVPQLPFNEKVQVINADVFDFIPEEKYNTIYIDIWNWINEDIYREQMKPLMTKFRKYLVPKSEDSHRFIDCWCHQEAKKGLRI